MNRSVFAPATPAAIIKAAVARSNVIVYAVVDAKAPAGLGTCISVSHDIHRSFGAGAAFPEQSRVRSSRPYGGQTWGGHSSCHLYRPMSARPACHIENALPRTAALSGTCGTEYAAFVDAACNFDVGNAHVVYTDKKLQDSDSDRNDRNHPTGTSAPAAQNRNQVRDTSLEDADRCAIGYAYLLPVCTNLYMSYSHPRATNAMFPLSVEVSKPDPDRRL